MASRIQPIRFHGCWRQITIPITGNARMATAATMSPMPSELAAACSTMAPTYSATTSPKAAQASRRARGSVIVITASRRSSAGPDRGLVVLAGAGGLFVRAGLAGRVSGGLFGDPVPRHREPAGDPGARDGPGVHAQ